MSHIIKWPCQPEKGPQQLTRLLRFLGLTPRELVLTRHCVDKTGEKTDVDVACAGTFERLERLQGIAARDPYPSADGTRWFHYLGSYFKPNLRVPSYRDWLDGDRPDLSAAAAVGFNFILLDFDPVRAVKGGMATALEVEETRVRADTCLRWLQGELGPDLSFALVIMSGNGFQLLIRCKGLEFHVARQFVIACSIRFGCDRATYDVARGCALPGTEKRKGMTPTLDRPYRMVEIAQSWPGSRTLEGHELEALLALLPAVPESAARRGEFEQGTATDAWGATCRLPVDSVLSAFGYDGCPGCGRYDGSVSQLTPSLLKCMRGTCHEQLGYSGNWGSQVVVGFKLGFGVGPYTSEQREQIIAAVQTAGFKLDFKPLDTSWAVSTLQPAKEQIQMPEQTVNMHRQIVVNDRWYLTSPSPALVAERVYEAIQTAYAPGLTVADRPLTFCGDFFAYLQDLGIWVPLADEGTSENRISRIIFDAESDSGGALAFYDQKGNLRRWSPNHSTVFKRLRSLTDVPTFFAERPMGVATQDGFVHVSDAGFVKGRHQPSNRALGFLRCTSDELIAALEMTEVSEAEAGLALLVERFVQQPELTADITRLLLESIGSLVLGLPAERHPILVLWGPSNAGKSKLASILERAAQRLGLIVCYSDVAHLNHRFPPESLTRASLVLSYDDDIFSKGPADPKCLKPMARGETITIDVKNQPPVNLVFRGIVIIVSNWRPKWGDSSEAMVNRCCAIPFPAGVEKGKEDPTLVSRYLEQHIDGLLIAAVKAARALVPSTARFTLGALAEQSAEVNRTPTAIETWLDQGPYERADKDDLNEWTPLQECYESCKDWMARNGHRRRSEEYTDSEFGLDLKDLLGGVKSARRGNPKVSYVALRARVTAESKLLAN